MSFQEKAIDLIDEAKDLKHIQFFVASCRLSIEIRHDSFRFIFNLDEGMTSGGGSFDLLVIGRRKLAGGGSNLGPPTRATLNKIRVRAVQQVFNDRRLLYRNRVQSNRSRLVLAAIEHNHYREQAHQRLQRYQILNDLKMKQTEFKATSDTIFSYPQPIDLTEPKDLYRFGVRVQSANPRIDPPPPTSSRFRSRSNSIVPRPRTAPVSVPFSPSPECDSLLAKTVAPAEETIQTNPSEPLERSKEESTGTGFTTHRITWPVRLKVFALADEDETRQQYLTWRAEQRQNRGPAGPNQMLDPENDLKLQRQYEQAIRKQQEIDAFITDELIYDHQLNDPVFAKRYRQLQIAVRTGKVPNYDPHDQNIRPRITKSSIQRTQSALVTAQEERTKYLRERQKLIQSAQLAERISVFLTRFDQFKETQNQ